MGLFSKKDADDGASISSKKSGMFRRNKTEEPNPYAVAAPPTAYQQARAGLATGPSPASPAPPPYQSPSMSSNGYGSEKVGSQAGYNRYGGSDGSAYGANSQASGRAGGYGGLGDTDENKDNLFGGAQKRYVAPPQNGAANGPASNQYGQPPSRSYSDDPNKSALLGAAPDRYAQNRYGQPGANDNQYDGYGEPRELTQEEQDELQVQADKEEIKRLKREGAESTNRSLAIANGALDTANSTLARLGMQGERLHNAEKNLDISANHSKVAEDRTKELKKLNGSMFNPHLGNPFTSSKRAAQRDADILERHRMERDQRQTTRADAFAANQRLDGTFKELTDDRALNSFKGASAAEKSKFAFEEDDEENEDEETIDQNTQKIAFAVGRLNVAARAIGTEVDSQNGVISRIGEKVSLSFSGRLYPECLLTLSLFRPMRWMTMSE